MRAAEKAVAFVKKCQALKLSYEETLVGKPFTISIIRSIPSPSILSPHASLFIQIIQEVSLAVDEIMPINVHMKVNPTLFAAA